MLFGVTIFYKEGDVVHKKKISVTSEYLRQDSLTVIASLTKVMKEQWFQEHNFEEIIFWSDGAAHFQNFHLLGFFGEILVQNASNEQKEAQFLQAIKEISPNLKKVQICNFSSAHGKGYLLSHFLLK